MLAVKCYDVKICSREIPMYNMSGRTNNTTISFKCPDNNSRNITVNVTVTVVDIKGQRSTSTVAKNITGMHICKI